jgi:hypothetical protein
MAVPTHHVKRHHELDPTILIRLRNAREAGRVKYLRQKHWHSNPITPRQRAYIAHCGIDPRGITSKGHAAALIDRLMRRRAAALATYKQVKTLRRFGVEKAHLIKLFSRLANDRPALQGTTARATTKGFQMSEPLTLRFVHRFRSGTLGTLTFYVAQEVILKPPHCHWNGPIPKFRGSRVAKQASAEHAFMRLRILSVLTLRHK